MPPPSDWLWWEFWVANRDNIVPLATFFVQLATLIGAVIVAVAALAQARTARRRHEAQTTADWERRIIESFAKAIELLGSDKLEMRLGGIYSLEQIAHQNEREYWPIMETLTAHVCARTLVGVSHEQWPGIAAVLTVLKRRKQSQDQGPLNLSGATLGVADLTNAPFQGANLQGARLEGADLTRANLRDANLRGVMLGGADLRETILMGADLRGADLQGTRMRSPACAGSPPARNLTQEQLNSAFGDEKTRLPAGLKPPPHWMVWGTPDTPDNPEL